MNNQQKKNGYHRIINKKTGQLKLAKCYKNGLIHGKYVYYWDNGQVRISGQYDRMHRVGIWRTYDSNGFLIQKDNYSSIKEKQKDSSQILLPL